MFSFISLKFIMTYVFQAPIIFLLKLVHNIQSHHGVFVADASLLPIVTSCDMLSPLLPRGAHPPKSIHCPYREGSLQLNHEDKMGM